MKRSLFLCMEILFLAKQVSCEGGARGCCLSERRRETETSRHDGRLALKTRLHANSKRAETKSQPVSWKPYLICKWLLNRNQIDGTLMFGYVLTKSSTGCSLPEPLEPSHWRRLGPAPPVAPPTYNDPPSQLVGGLQVI